MYILYMLKCSNAQMFEVQMENILLDRNRAAVSQQN